MGNAETMMEAWASVMQESSLLEGEVPDVLVVIATIRGREALLERALKSIRGEEVPFAVLVERDSRGQGPAVVRNRGVEFGIQEYGFMSYVAFLDDDDEFKPGHLTKLVRHSEATGADVVYPWFDLMYGPSIDNSKDPLAMNGKPAFGQEFDPTALDTGNFIPVTTLVRTSKFRAVGGFPIPGSEEWPHLDCEDWALWRKLRDNGATFSHLPERTWQWNVHGKNTSGRPDAAKRIYGV